MSRDSDFAAFLAARWPRVVRSLVLLGGSPDEAGRVARTAFARLRRGWGRGADEPEVQAWREVLTAWRERPWTGVPGDAGPSGVAALEPALDRLTPEVRTALVLRAVAGLSPAQVGLVLDRVPAAGEQPAEAEVLAAAEEVEVAPAPTPGALAGAPWAPRRRRPGVPVAVAALALLVGVGTWLGTRPADELADAAPRVTRVENAAEVAWWANNVLHLPHVDVELPRVTDLVEIADGAVVGDEQGRVFVVDDAGVVTRIGHKSPREPLVGSDVTGWAAWVDPTGDVPRLVVQDVTAGSQLASREVPAGDEVRPIALDRETLYYGDREGNWQWEPGRDDPLRVLQPGLVDIVEATEARQIAPRRLELVQPFFNVMNVVPGEDAELSPDATYALTRAPGTGRRDQFGSVRIYDVRSGDPLWTGLTARDIAVAATLGPDDEVHYVIARRGDRPESGEYVRSSFSGPYELRTCHVGERTCFTVGRFPHTGALPVLAR